MPDWGRWTLDFNDHMPIYKQIILRFYRAFVRGEISPGERVPSIRDMSAVLQVNTNTVQRVYQTMERDELIGSKRGTGYFFTEDAAMIEKTYRILALDSLKRFVEEMRGLGCKDADILSELKFYMEGGGQVAVSN